jgi:zinc protease
MTDLETITREDLIAYYKVYYRPNNAVLVVAGDVRHDQVLELTRRHFGGIARGPEVPAVQVVEPDQRGERTVRVHKEVQLPGVVIAYRAPESTHADAAPINIGEYILFRGRSSRLYQRLIYQEPLAVDLSGGFYIRKDPSTFVIRAAARPGVDVERLRAAVIEAVESLAATPPTAKEIEKARNQIDADFIFGQEHNFELGQGLGSYECLSTWQSFFEFHEACLAATSDDVARAARSWFDERQRTCGYLIAEGGEE